MKYNKAIYKWLFVEEISEDNGLKIIKMWNRGVKDVELTWKWNL
jgi:hypothetical protein